MIDAVWKRNWIFQVIIGLMILAGLIGINLRLAPDIAEGNDFQTLFTAGQVFFQKGESPYDLGGPKLIQQDFQDKDGRLSGQGTSFHLPIYALFFTAPLVLLGEGLTAQIIWMLLMEILFVGAVYLAMKLTGWKPEDGFELMAVGLLLMFSPPVVLTLRSGEMAVISLAALVQALDLIDSDRPLPGGFFLALSTVAPRFGLLILPVLIFRGLLQGQGRLILSFLVSLAVLISLPLLVVPAWPLEWIWINVTLLEQGVIQSSLLYRLAEQFQGVFNIAAVVFFGTVLFIILGEWIVARHDQRERFLWSVFFTLACTVPIAFPQKWSNALLHIPGIILVSFMGLERWGRKGKLLTIGGVLSLVAAFWLIANSADALFAIQWIISGISIVGLWWARWWFAHPLLRKGAAGRLE